MRLQWGAQVRNERGSRATYDDQGRAVEHAHDSEADGTYDTLTVYQWRADHQIQSWHTDTDLDGDWDTETLFTYEHDLMVLREDVGPELTGTVQYAWDGQGHALWREEDSDGDGLVDNRSDYETDARGNITRNEHDFEADGVVDIVWAWTWNRWDNPVEEYLGDDDGWARVIHYSWNRDLLTAANYRDFHSGERTATMVYTYDTQGRLLTDWVDVGMDGYADATRDYVWDCP